MPYSKCNDINVYYEIHGQGKPLLFLNGLASDIPKKMSIINALKKHFQVIVHDNRGVGKTDKPEQPYSIAQLASDTYQLLGNINIRKCSVIGFSMGGFIASQLALDHPEIIEKLILVSTTPGWSRPYPPPKEADRIFHSTEVSEQLLIDLFNITYGSNYRKRVSAKSYVRARLADTNPQPLHGYLNQLHACENYDICDQIAGIKAPTLIITGKEDLSISPENSRWLHKNIKNSKLIEYEGVGHMTVDEVPEKIAEAVKAAFKAVS